MEEMMPAIRYLAWAWLIIIGALMLTPGGVSCIACGETLNSVLGVVSIVLGAAAIFIQYRGLGATARG
jgi:hypothetical protein